MPDAHPEIFFSHADRDDEIVTRIHDELEARTGRSIWVDHVDIMAGDEWQDEIEHQIKIYPELLNALTNLETYKRHSMR